MRVPDWLTKFASRKLLALAGTLVSHYLISRGMESHQAAEWADAVVQLGFIAVDAWLTREYIREQAKLDHAERFGKSVGDIGVDAVTSAARKAVVAKKADDEAELQGDK